MMRSIIDDVKREFSSGNMITKIIIANVAIFMVTAIVEAFAPSFYHNTLMKWIAMSGEPMTFITRPWTIFTSMFVHAGLGHILWNMVLLYWFGRIVGDLIGDRHILPIYLLGGILGNIAYMVSYVLFPSFIGSYAVGASAAIMALVIIAGLINPDHEIRLLFIGIVKIKFIILFIIFMDIIGIGKQNNTGGHIAHLGGLLMGWYYYIQLGNGVDYAKTINGWIDSIFGATNSRSSVRKSPLKVQYKSEKIMTMAERRNAQTTASDHQDEVDSILEKIKAKGYESLTDEEKETLYQASKK